MRSHWQASVRADLIDHSHLVERTHDPMAGVCTLGEPELNPCAWAKEVPAALLEEILKAGSILVAGDADSDGTGSAIALARTLRALGKRAVAYASSPPPLELQPLLDPNELATEVRGTFDLVIHVDQDGSRVDPAVHQAAPLSAVIDHHQVAPKATVSWIDPGADAAALMVLGLIIRLTADADLDPDVWKRIVTPLLAAIDSDTHGLSQTNTRPSTYGIVKYLLHHTGADVCAVMEAFDPFSAELKQLARDTIDARIEGDRPRRTGVFKLDGAGFQTILEAIQREHPSASDEDAYHLVVATVQSVIDEVDIALSVALIERTDHIKISTRSKAPDDAVVMARAFGGNGKPGEGGSALRHDDRSLDAEQERALRWLESWRNDQLGPIVQKLRAGSL